MARGGVSQVLCVPVCVVGGERLEDAAVPPDRPAACVEGGALQENLPVHRGRLDRGAGGGVLRLGEERSVRVHREDAPGSEGRLRDGLHARGVRAAGG